MTTFLNSLPFNWFDVALVGVLIAGILRGRIAWRDGLIQALEGEPIAEAAARDSGLPWVLPGFVDSHSHLVFAGDRAEEFAARISGQPYAAGGIRTTVAAVRDASDADLAATAQHLVGHLGRATHDHGQEPGLVIDQPRHLDVLEVAAERRRLDGAGVERPRERGLFKNLFWRQREN